MALKLPVWTANGALLLCAIFWGTGFVAQRLAAQQMGDTPFTFNAARFLIGALLLLPFVVTRPALRRWSTWRGGAIAGLVMVIAASLQQKAMATVAPGTAGFITGTYVVWTPLLGLLWGLRVSARFWIGALLCVTGLWVMSIRGQPEIATGDLYLIGCACMWAVHVHVIGWCASREDGLGISLVQLLVTGALSAMIAGASEPVSGEMLSAGTGPILFSAVFSIALAFTLQVVAQSSAPAAHAAVLLSLESVFAELSGALWLHESFDGRKWIGASLMLIGALVATVTAPRGTDPPRQSSGPSPPGSG
ncbi:MAG: DMT family transporter [Planctomycetes bacterium]|nr:DMT family transporter [Planctomycetota bacterium]